MRHCFKITLEIILSITSPLIAQHDFRPGSITTNNNETIEGYIDYAPVQSNALTCNFRLDSSSAVKLYLPRDLKEYSFKEGKRYITKTVEIDDVSRLYFLDCLVKGDVNLYYMKNLGLDYYFIEQSANLYELSNNRVSYTDNGKTYEANPININEFFLL